MRPFRRLISAAALCSLALLAHAGVATWFDAGARDAIAITAAGLDGRDLIARSTAADPRRSSDGGRTWTAFTVDGARPLRFAGSPIDGNTFHALVGGSYDGLFGDALPSALYRSTDGGATWQRVTSQMRGPSGEVLGNVIAGAEPGLLYAHRMAVQDCMIGCSYVGAEPFVSHDGGTTWKSIGTGVASTAGITLHPAASDPRVVYARAGRVYRSADYGTTWTLVRNGDGGLTWNNFELAVDRQDANTIYLRPSGKPEHVVSEDGGVTWRLESFTGLPNSGRLVADPRQAGRAYYVDATGEVFETSDRARSWTRIAARTDAYLRDYWSAQPTQGLAPIVGLEDGNRVFVAPTYDGVKRAVAAPEAFGVGSDLWWNPAESGWGITITQHAGGQVFAVWFTYDAQGNPVWRAIPGGTWSDSRTFSGRIYETRGPAYFTGPFDPARVARVPVGHATIAFSDDDNAVFSYVLDDGSAADERITRQLFSPPNDWSLENFADLWWNAAESGWGVVANHQFGKIFATWFVYDDAGRPTWIVMPDANYSYVTVGSFSRPRYSGDIYTTTGPPAGAPFDPARVVTTRVGTATLTFFDRDSAELAYQAFGRNEARAVTRQPF